MNLLGFKVIQNPYLLETIITRKQTRKFKNKRWNKKYKKKYSRQCSMKNVLIDYKNNLLICHPEAYQVILNKLTEEKIESKTRRDSSIKRVFEKMYDQSKEWKANFNPYYGFNIQKTKPFF